MNMSQLVPISGSRIDYYAATLPDAPGASARDLLIPLIDEKPVPTKGTRGYQYGYALRREGVTWGHLLEAPGKRDHVYAAGHPASDLHRLFGNVVPGHSVSRADVCMDFAGAPNLYELGRELLDRNLSPALKRREIRHLGLGAATESSTLYLGSRESEVFMRFYESGKRHPGLPPEAVRLECEVKPTNSARKQYAATLDDPVAFYGWSRSSRHALDLLADLAAPVVQPRPKPEPDLDRVLNHLASQYRNALEALLNRHGGDLQDSMLDLMSRIPGLEDETSEGA